MGFFGDLKNKVTGGAAVVTIQAPVVTRGQQATIRVQAVAKANGKVAAVYLLVRGTERASWKADGEKVENSASSFDTKIVIAGALELKAGESYTWDGQLELPHTALPSLRGKLIEHEWQIQGGLDMPGNDPDSGWHTFEVR